MLYNFDIIEMIQIRDLTPIQGFSHNYPPALFIAVSWWLIYALKTNTQNQFDHSFLTGNTKRTSATGS